MFQLYHLLFLFHFQVTSQIADLNHRVNNSFPADHFYITYCVCSIYFSSRCSVTHTHRHQSLPSAKMWLATVQFPNRIQLTALNRKRQWASLNNPPCLQITSATHKESETKSQIITFASSALLLWQIKEVWKPYFSEQRVLSLLLAKRLTNWLVLITTKPLQQTAFSVAFYKDLQERSWDIQSRLKNFVSFGQSDGLKKVVKSGNFNVLKNIFSFCEFYSQGTNERRQVNRTNADASTLIQSSHCIRRLTQVHLMWMLPQDGKKKRSKKHWVIIEGSLSPKGCSVLVLEQKSWLKWH